ncbi:hypothetical protein AB0M47_08675 [Hamadaea sp. NPDC051192]|uniref:hypothetical protein n=1 Tax=Hamadaea sp. NPDC051192 TaxID=3154940 RepID=UPI003441A6B4
MTYNIAVWDGPKPADDATAMQVFLAMHEAAASSWDAPTTRMEVYVQALLARWPDIDDDETDSSPWADGPILNNATGPFFYTSLRPSMADNAIVYCARVATEHGLVCFDPQQERLVTADATLVARLRARVGPVFRSLGG